MVSYTLNKVNDFKNHISNRNEMIEVISKIFRIKQGLLMFYLLLTCNVMAQESETFSSSRSETSGSQFSNSINMCPISVAFGLYSTNFEHLFGQTHGIVGRFDYEAISDSYSDNPIKVSGYGFILNYRYHFSHSMESIYIGSYVRYRIYDGNGTAGSTNFNFKIKEATIGLNAGKRWVWENGFNITFSLGYGISTNKRETSPNISSVEKTINPLKMNMLLSVRF